MIFPVEKISSINYFSATNLTNQDYLPNKKFNRKKSDSFGTRYQVEEYEPFSLLSGIYNQKSGLSIPRSTIFLTEL